TRPPSLVLVQYEDSSSGILQAIEAGRCRSDDRYKLVSVGSRGFRRGCPGTTQRPGCFEHSALIARGIPTDPNLAVGGSCDPKSDTCRLGLAVLELILVGVGPASR